METLSLLGLAEKIQLQYPVLQIENEGFLYCIQRYLNINALGILGPEEIPIDVEFSMEEELYAYMVAITIALIEGNGSKFIAKNLVRRIMINK